jgi:hypothetical protein
MVIKQVYYSFDYYLQFFQNDFKKIILPIIKWIYIIFISTITYSISYIIYLMRKSEMNILLGIFHIILQLLFIFDIIDTLYLHKIYRKMIKNEINENIL